MCCVPLFVVDSNRPIIVILCNLIALEFRYPEGESIYFILVVEIIIEIIKLDFCLHPSIHKL